MRCHAFIPQSPTFAPLAVTLPTASDTLKEEAADAELDTPLSALGGATGGAAPCVAGAATGVAVSRPIAKQAVYYMGPKKVEISAIVEQVNKNHCWVRNCAGMGQESGLRKRLDLKKIIAEAGPAAAKGPLPPPPAKGPLPPAEEAPASAPSSSSTQDAAAAKPPVEIEDFSSIGDMFSVDTDY